VSENYEHVRHASDKVVPQNEEEKALVAKHIQRLQVND